MNGGNDASHDLIASVARVSRQDRVIPDALSEIPVGRECYAFSEQEDEAFRNVEKAARDALAHLREGVDYTVEHDAIGNMFVELRATNGNEKSVMVGSHLDSVVDGGMYDGVAGVAMGFGMLQELAQKPHRLQGFTLAVFRSEESSPRNGLACLGSSIATGTISREKLEGVMYDAAGKVTLKEHITKKFGAERWDEVLRNAESPRITEERYSMYLEGHIEQSAVIQTRDSDVGIVEGGIGGAIREKASVALEPEEVNTPEGEYKKVTFTFLGESNHTGGTPPNPKFYRESDVTWYRKDALVGAGEIISGLLLNPDIHLISARPEKETGFTSAPSHAHFEMLMPEPQFSSMQGVLMEMNARLATMLGVEMRVQDEPVTQSVTKTVNKERARALVALPREVSRLATEAFTQQGTETGTTRATITDLIIEPTVMRCNLDFREVNTEHIRELRQRVHERADELLAGASFDRISEKPHSPVAPHIVQALRESAEQQGFSYIRMPSAPGHDADRVAATGIPTGMIFIRHNGLSHNPKEHMEKKDFDTALSVMRQVILREVTGSNMAE